MSTHDIVSLIFFIIAVIWVFSVLISGAKDEARMRSLGIPATLLVTSLQATGRWAANNPVVGISGDVLRDDTQQIYPVHFTEMIPPGFEATIQPGKALKILVDPDNPQIVLIDEAWNR